MRSLSNSTRYRLAAIGVLLLAFGLRSYTLAARALWFDEVMEYWVATTPLPDLLEVVKTALRDPPLYSYLLHFWVLLGDNETWLRFPSLLCSMSGLLGVMTMTRLAFGKRAALVAALLVAVAAPDIRFAQEAGQYIFMLCFLAWSLVFLLLLLQRDAWQWAVLWGVAAVLATYSFYGPPITIGITALVSAVYLIAGRRWRALLLLAAAGSAVVLMMAPLVLDILPAQLAQPTNAATTPAPFGAVGVEAQAFLTGAGNILRYQQMGYQPRGWPWPGFGEWIVWLPVVLLLAAGTQRYWQSLPFVWLGSSFLAYYLVSKSGLYHFEGRYSLIIAPLLWSCIAAGVVAVWARQKAVAAILLGAIVLVSLLAPPEPPEDLRSVTQAWLVERTADEPTYVYYGAAPGFRYQLRQAGVDDQAIGPWYTLCWQGKQTPACTSDGVMYGRWIRDFTPERKRASILATMGDEPARFWIIFAHAHPGEAEELLTALGDAYAIVKRLPAENAEAVLLERR